MARPPRGPPVARIISITGLRAATTRQRVKRGPLLPSCVWFGCPVSLHRIARGPIRAHSVCGWRDPRPRIDRPRPRAEAGLSRSPSHHHRTHAPPFFHPSTAGRPNKERLLRQEPLESEIDWRARAGQWYRRRRVEQRTATSHPISQSPWCVADEQRALGQHFCGLGLASDDAMGGSERIELRQPVLVGWTPRPWSISIHACI